MPGWSGTAKPDHPGFYPQGCSTQKEYLCRLDQPKKSGFTSFCGTLGTLSSVVEKFTAPR